MNNIHFALGILLDIAPCEYYIEFNLFDVIVIVLSMRRIGINILYEYYTVSISTELLIILRTKT